MNFMMRSGLLLTGAFLTALSACDGESESRTSSAAAAPDPCAIVLASTPAEGGSDPEITRAQTEARAADEPAPALERLGWSYVAAARRTYDNGWYNLAEQTALCLDVKSPGRPEALLLRGHALHSLHRFQEAEPLARKLVAERGLPHDFALLGDVLTDRGRLRGAIGAYQAMLDLKPGMQSYSRAAHMRWLKGDLYGALQLMRLAARAGNPRSGEPVAWTYARVAMLELQAGNAEQALAMADAALEVSPDHAPALLARGHVLLAQGRFADALPPLQRAAALNPLPEYQWALADAFHAADRAAEARGVEARLLERGAAEDPRTFALYLATRRERPEIALRLAERELGTRQDVFTHDALAWALAAAGRADEAWPHVERALAEGTQDARLFYHAGAIAAMIPREEEARQWFGRAAGIGQMLLPGEREELRAAMEELGIRQTESPQARGGDRKAG
ncbi:MAG: tetratricopeptide repeat protein [Gemmatimonadetes bacterium]|nr:tetratricopeptide repeat protein [Gemmatimonadota bacterium]